MTDDQLEAAARHLCRLRGADPDERVYHADGIHQTLCLISPAWMVALPEIKHRLQVDEAIAFGRAVQPGQKETP